VFRDRMIGIRNTLKYLSPFLYYHNAAPLFFQATLWATTKKCCTSGGSLAW
jgi:hypothetical protein